MGNGSGSLQSDGSGRRGVAHCAWWGSVTGLHGCTLTVFEEFFRFRFPYRRLSHIVTIQRAGCDDPRSAATNILVGVPEDIGIRANGGRGGAASPPDAHVQPRHRFSIA